jgi:hypothetical protein
VSILGWQGGFERVCWSSTFAPQNQRIKRQYVNGRREITAVQRKLKLFVLVSSS